MLGRHRTLFVDFRVFLEVVNDDTFYAQFMNSQNFLSPKKMTQFDICPFIYLEEEGYFEEWP